MAEYLEAEHVLALASGTAALHLSLVALGVGPGDEVITTPITWPATANVIVHAGATPCSSTSARTTSTSTLRCRRSCHRADEGDPARRPRGSARRPRSDLGARPAGVEDAAHAAESRYRGRKVGAIADVTCFSLYATKNIAAGEGGLVSTNRDDVAQALNDLRQMRRGDGSRYDIPVPATRRTSPTCSPRSRSASSTRSSVTPRSARASSRLRRGGRGARRDHAARARRPRHARAASLCRSRSTPSAQAQRGTSTSARSPTRTSSTSIHFLPVHTLDVLPRAIPGPAAAARRGTRGRRGDVAAALAGALGRRHRRRGRGTPPSARTLHAMTAQEGASGVVLTLAVTGASVSPTSSGSSTSGRRSTSSSTRTSAGLRARCDHVRGRAADGVPVAEAARGARRARGLAW